MAIAIKLIDNESAKNRVEIEIRYGLINPKGMIEYQINLLFCLEAIEFAEKMIAARYTEYWNILINIFETTRLSIEIKFRPEIING